MVLSDHVIWKYKDALEETRRANHSVARFLKVQLYGSQFHSNLVNARYSKC